jgi:hypothetical protein
MMRLKQQTPRTQIPIKEFNPMFAWAFAPSNLQKMRHRENIQSVKV